MTLIVMMLFVGCGQTLCLGNDGCVGFVLSNSTIRCTAQCCQASNVPVSELLDSSCDCTQISFDYVFSSRTEHGVEYFTVGECLPFHQTDTAWDEAFLDNLYVPTWRHSSPPTSLALSLRATILQL